MAKYKSQKAIILEHLETITFLSPVARNVLSIIGKIGIVAAVIGSVIFILVITLTALNMIGNFAAIASSVLKFGAFFLVAGAILIFASFIFHLQHGIICAVVGFIFFYSPTIIAMVMTVYGATEGLSDSIDNILKTIQNVGLFLIFVGIINILAHYIKKFFVDSNEKSGKFEYIEDDTLIRGVSMFPKCWEMSRCRPAVRRTCPNFIAKKNCWKRRSGCFCDKGLAQYLIDTSNNLNSASEMEDIQKIALEQKEKAKEINKRIENKKKRAWKLQKKMCHSCPVFLEHQEFKYRRNTWLSLPFTALVMVAAYPFIKKGYDIGAGFLDSKIKNVSSLPENFNFSTDLQGSAFEYVVIGMIAIWVFSMMVALVDNIFLKWKM